jgi:hypothetical protein
MRFDDLKSRHLCLVPDLGQLQIEVVVHIHLKDHMNTASIYGEARQGLSALPLDFSTNKG